MLKDKLLRICVLSYACCSLILYFWELRWLAIASLLPLLYILGFAVATLQRGGRNVVLCLLAAATVLMLYARADLAQWVQGLRENAMLVALFIFAPLLHLPYTYEDYQGELKNMARLYMHTMLPFHLLVSLSTHIFAALTGFATFAIMYNLFLRTSKLYKADDLFIATLGRSYATSGFWGTSWASVILVVNNLGIAWHRLILVGMLFTAASFAVNLGGIQFKMLRAPGRYPAIGGEPNTVVRWRSIGAMLLLSALIVGATLAINLYTGWSLLAVVPLLAIVLPPCIALMQRKGACFREGVRQYADKNLYKYRMEVALFTAAGLLAYALQISGVGALVAGLVPEALHGRPFLLSLLFMLLIILPGQLGVHPIATGSTLLAVIQPGAIGLSVPQFALAVLAGWLLSNMLSPFSALNITLSGLTGRSTFHTGLKLNWKYALLCLFVYAGLILLLSPLLG